MTEMTQIIKINFDQRAEIGEYHIMVEYNVYKITKTGQSMIRTIEMTLEEVILEEI